MDVNSDGDLSPSELRTLLVWGAKKELPEGADQEDSDAAGEDGGESGEGGYDEGYTEEDDDDDDEEEEEEEEAPGGAGGKDGGGSGAMDVDGASQHANARLSARARARPQRFRKESDDEQPPAGRRAGRVKRMTEADAQGAAASKRRRRR